MLLLHYRFCRSNLVFFHTWWCKGNRYCIFFSYLVGKRVHETMYRGEKWCLYVSVTILLLEWNTMTRAVHRKNGLFWASDSIAIGFTARVAATFETHKKSREHTRNKCKALNAQSPHLVTCFPPGKPDLLQLPTPCNQLGTKYIDVQEYGDISFKPKTM